MAAPRTVWLTFIKSRAFGIALIAVGLATLALVGTYAGYRAYGRANLEDLNFSVEEPEIAVQIGGEEASRSGVLESTAQKVEPVGPTRSLEPDVQGEVQVALDVPLDPGPEATAPESPAGRLSQVYALALDGVVMHPKYWHEPLRAGTEMRSAPGLPEGFIAASAHDYRRFVVPKALATRLSIPSIGVDSTVSELAIVNLNDSRAYETPKNTVGHIPETADPGELGNGWFFGHLESPFRGEGNVFQRLPEIPDLLRHYADVGEGSVYVILESDSGQFLYEAVSTRVVHADELRLYDTDGVYITLVTCVPRLDYTHRLVVTAELVGVGL